MAYSVSYTYRIIDRFTAPLKKITQQTDKFKSTAGRASVALRGMSGRLSGLQNTMASVAGTIGGAAMVQQFTGFEDAMNSVNAVSQATEGQFASLRDTAVTMGRTTKFSATEAALGMDMLARNGLKVGQVLGAIPSTLNLAAATGSTLANSANIATDVMFNFGKTAADLEPIMDKIAGVTVRSKMDIDNYRLALGMAGGVAGKVGVGLDDFNTVIAATAGSFSSGSDAGTSFKNFLVRLEGDTKPAKAIMKRLGLFTHKTGSAFFDATGKMKSMSEISELLRNALSGLSDQQKTNAVSTIFGMDAMRTALALASVGSEQFDALAASIQSVSAQEMAEKRMQGLTGVLTILKSTLQTLSIAIFDAGLVKWLMSMAKGLTNFASWLSQTHPWLLKIIGAVGLAAIAFGPMVLALSVVATGLSSVVTLLPVMAVGLAAITSPIWGTVAAIAALTAGVAVLVAKWREIWGFISKIPSSVIGLFGGGFDPEAALGFAGEAPITEKKLATNFQSLADEWKAINADMITGVAAANVAATMSASTLNGRIDVTAPPGVVKSASMETSAPGDLGFNLAGS